MNAEGRPTLYKKQYDKQAYKLCLLGYTDAELAAFFEVNEDTIHEWKKVHPKFSESIKDGKDKADGEVVASLYKRAKGYSYTEKTKEPVFNPSTQQFDYIVAKEVKKEVPPDTGAAMAWLKNRQKKHWRDNKELDVNLNAKLEDFIK